MPPITPQSHVFCLSFVLLQSARKESNLQPSSYKDAALTTEPRAVSGAGEIRTLAERIKSPSCCQLHHNPKNDLGYAFQSLKHVWFSFVFVVVSGSPEDRTRHNLVISKAWTTSPRLPFFSAKVGHLGVEPPVAERPRSTQSPAPKAGVLPSAPVSDVCCRFRWRRSSLSVGRETLESSSAVLQTAARPPQLPAHVGFWSCPTCDTKKGSMPA